MTEHKQPGGHLPQGPGDCFSRAHVVPCLAQDDEGFRV